MFAVIYRCSIYPERENEFRDTWRQIADFFINQCGALGSCLHQTEQGEWVAYSRWPTQAMRDAAWIRQENLTDEIQAAVATLKSCIDITKPYEEICMQAEEDLF